MSNKPKNIKVKKVKDNYTNISYINICMGVLNYLNDRKDGMEIHICKSTGDKTITRKTIDLCNHEVELRDLVLKTVKELILKGSGAWQRTDNKKGNKKLSKKEQLIQDVMQHMDEMYEGDSLD